ncbi:MAG: hypothetical protein IJX12_04895, partial [Lachnospiraceae bacterium]|nr:hypothetical protein [Lachnospiraceae bacterium]
NLKMIHIYDLSGAKADVKNITSLAVYYGNNKQKNLCAMDKHYSLLVERVLYLYSRAEDKSAIMMDEATKKLMDEACVGVEDSILAVSKLGKKYLSWDGEDIPRVNNQTYVRYTAMPMIKYYLTEIYSMLEMPIEFKEDKLGWHGNVILEATVGDKELIFPVRFSYDSVNSYSVYIGNFLKEKSTITFEVSYESKQFTVNFYSEDSGLLGQSSFIFGENSGLSKTSISINDTLVYYQDTSIVEAKVEDVAFFAEQGIVELLADSIHIWRLPWNSYYIFESTVNENGDILRTDFDTGYIDWNEEAILLRQYGVSHIENKSTGLKIRINGTMVERLMPDKRNPGIQTCFYPVGYYSNWDYKNKLENKYFYEEIKEK